MSLSVQFAREYERLNPAQKDAVDAIDGPVMVVAGPGTGKTQILALRIGKILLETDTPPSGILALTFTEPGAKEMKRRLRSIIGARAEEVRIHTYHGFASSVISEFPDHFPHLSKARQITEIEAETLIRQIIKSERFSRLRPGGEPDFYVGKILDTIQDSKKEAWSPEIIRSFAREEMARVKDDPAFISSRGATKGQIKGEGLKRLERCERTAMFADVYEAYEAKKKEGKKIDFDDLIIEVLKALREDKVLLQMLQEKFLYILVDEHQDTNDSQNALIRTMADFFETPNIFVVGDEKQAIHRFQGASVENFLHFQDIWKSMRVVPLVKNYRSHQKILDASFAMIENNYTEGEHEDLRVKLAADSDDEARPVDVVMAGNTEAADKYLVEKLKEILKTDPDKTVAVITRRNRDVEYMMSLLEQNDIPAQAERGVDIFSHPIGILFFDFIQYLRNPGDIEALSRTLAMGLWNLDFASRASLIRAAKSGHMESVEEKIPDIKNLQSGITKEGAIGYLVHAADISGFTKISSGNPLSAEVWRSIVSVAKDLSLQNSIQSPAVLIEELLAYRLSAEEKGIKITVGRPGSKIKIMTVHGSKGLEFDYVFIPFATEDSWIFRGFGTYFILPRKKGDGDELRDVRRLFYVAITRARKHVSILCGLEDGMQKTLTPLRFISELDPACVSRIEVPSVFENRDARFSGSVDIKRKAEMINHAKYLIQEYGISPTALNHFIACPSQFFYKSILKVPEAPNANSEKGIAMHEALARAWLSRDDSEEAVLATIQSAVKSYIDRSLLPQFEKGPIIEDLIESVPHVVSALSPLFRMPAKAYTEYPVEASHEVHYEKDKFNITLHGELDLILEGEDKTLVIDYKTREAMSVNAIKGETKNSDGKYFRQLVFYKILLGANSRFKNKLIEPALMFIKPDSKGRCPIISLPITTDDEENLKNQIQALVESIWSGNFLAVSCEDKSCEWCALKKATVGNI